MSIVKILNLLILALLLEGVAYAQAAQNTVTFTDNSSGETGFDLYRCTGTACPPIVKIITIPANTVAAPSTVTFFDNSVLEGNIYCYKVNATNGAITSTFSNVSCNTAPIPLSAPTNLLVK